MITEYYCTNEYNKLIYCSFISYNYRVETTLYVGNKLVKRKSLERGIHVLEKDTIKLKCQIKWFKTIPELWFGNKNLALKKLSRKNLRKELANLNIHNEINPKEQIKEPYDYRQLTTPIILLFVGIICQLLTNPHETFWKITVSLLYIIACFQISSPLVEKIPHRYLDESGKIQLKLIGGIVGMANTAYLVALLSKSLGTFVF